jgi:hypothetical protein
MPNVKKGTIYIKAPFKVAKDNCSYYPYEIGCHNNRWLLHSYWVKNNPEWFEEVKEKDYEQIAGHIGYITAVKRLSDGEIFEIDDKIILNSNDENLQGIITGFFEESNKLWIEFNIHTTNYKSNTRYACSLEGSKKYKQPATVGWWKQFEDLLNDAEFIKERNTLLGMEYTEEDMIDFANYYHKLQGRPDGWGRCILKKWLESRD